MYVHIYVCMYMYFGGKMFCEMVLMKHWQKTLGLPTYFST